MTTLFSKLAIMRAAAFACVFFLGPAQAAEVIRATVAIDAAKPGPVIEPEIYGHFSEHLGEGMYGGLWVGPKSKIPNTRGFRNDVVAALKELGIPVLRWPGGCYADLYHWRNGIGPRAKRPVTINNTWGNVEETNEVGTHEFLDLAAQLGAKPYINANVGTGSPQEIKDWLEYMTSASKSSLAEERRRNGRAEPWKIDYFAFGNELWQCGGNMRPEFYMDLYHWHANFAKTPEGNRPKQIAAGAYDDNVAWTEAIMKSNTFGDIDAVTLHHFSLPTGSWSGSKGASIGFGEDHWMSIMRRALDMDRYIRAHSAVMDKYDPEKKVALYIDEWSNWYDVDEGTNRGFLRQQNTLRDAVTAALNLNIFHAHADRVKMANITQMVNVLQAMILTDGEKMLLTPTYHVFMMYKPFRSAAALPVKVKSPAYRFGEDAVPAVHVSAARDGEGRKIVALVNIDPHRPASLAVTGVAAGEISGEILTAEAMDARNTFEAPEALKPAPFSGASFSEKALSVELPAKSVVVLIVR